jgi:RNA-directed DNA polymerase
MLLTQAKERRLPMRLRTPEEIKSLQRKLYQKAKQETSYRFYLLYDKVYRWDVLSYAYRLEKANGGAPGVDGETFEAIEGGEGVEAWLRGLQEELHWKRYRPQAVRSVHIPKRNGGERVLQIPTVRDRVVQMACKVVIEPIFEGGFKTVSYGYRPGRDAKQAARAITAAMSKGYLRVVDADIEGCFDHIPHGALMKCVVKRIVDKHLLHLIKLWLKVPVEEEGTDGRKRWGGGKKKKEGIPQGGVLSPLLANIYLHYFDVLLQRERYRRNIQGWLVRYADDFVILCQEKAEEVMEVSKEVLKRMGLRLNERKSRIVEAKEESFDFLSYTFQLTKSSRSGKDFPHVRPSKEARERLRQGLKELTCRRMLAVSERETIERINRLIRGWGNYFYHGNCCRDFQRLNEHIKWRVRRYLMRRRQRKGHGYERYSSEYLYRTLCLYRLPTVAPWKVMTNASG